MAILYITQQGAMLHKSGNQIIVKKEREVLQEIPIVHLDEVVIFGNGHITTPTMGYLLSKNIPVSFLSSQGKYKGKLQPPYAKDTLIRKQQYAVAADPPQCLALAKMFRPRENNERDPVFATATHPKCSGEIGNACCRVRLWKNLNALRIWNRSSDTRARVQSRIMRRSDNFWYTIGVSHLGSFDHRLTRSTPCFHSVIRSYTTMCMHSQMSSG